MHQEYIADARLQMPHDDHLGGVRANTKTMMSSQDFGIGASTAQIPREASRLDET
jgi:hypothetical protein